jgi:hypothetical protein
MDRGDNDSSLLYCYVAAHLRYNRRYACQSVTQAINQPVLAQQAVNRYAAPVMWCSGKMAE